MKNLRILVVVLPLVFLTSADVSAQVRVAVTGGVTRLVEERCDAMGTPGSSSTGAGGVNPATCVGETHYGRTRSYTGFSAGLSGIMPLTGAFGIELGSVYSQWKRSSGFPHVTNLAVTALGRVNLPWAKNGLRASLMAGPALTFPHERRLDLGLAAGAELEYAIDEDLGFTLGTVYTYGMRNLATYTDRGEYVRLRNVVIRSGLVTRFR